LQLIGKISFELDSNQARSQPGGEASPPKNILPPADGISPLALKIVIKKETLKIKS